MYGRDKLLVQFFSLIFFADVVNADVVNGVPVCQPLHHNQPDTLAHIVIFSIHPAQPDSTTVDPAKNSRSTKLRFPVDLTSP